MRVTHIALSAVLGVMLVGVSAATARSGGDDEARTRLIGYEEVPAISSDGMGRFQAEIDRSSIRYVLRYDGLEDVQQAHIHFGQKSVAGGISVFLCTNLGNGPTGTPTCPESGQVSGMLSAASVVGPTAQGIDPGELSELIDAIDAGIAYVNVHTAKFPSGEIRGQLDGDDDHEGHGHGDDD
jgi:hypothetical protein